VFETIRVREGKIPFLAEHLERLGWAVQQVGLPPLPADLESRLVRHASAGEAVLKVTVGASGCRIESRAVPESTPMRIVISGTRYEPYPIKRTAREVFDRARGRVVPYRADEVLLLTAEGWLAEGCITSVFFWMADTLCTPTLELGILPGIGRARVLALAAARGLAVREDRFRREEFAGLPLFLVNAVRGMVDITQHGQWRPSRDDRTSWLAAAFWG
jgi:branched-subunit amino acid aminotransferase/4-amino-4-deoxychorismate lyase